MPAAARHHLFTLDAYFRIDEASRERFEFWHGQVLLMAGGSPRHDYLESRVATLLSRELADGPCYTMTSNRRLATADDLYTYADGSVFCGEMAFGPNQTALNPVVVVEVLSDGTRAYDRGEKLERYRSIPSLRHVVLIEQDAVDVEVWSRTEAGWARVVHVSGGDSTVRLPGIRATLDVADLYKGADRFPTS